VSRVLTIFNAVTRNWLRSRSGLFFSFLFPVIFLLLFGSIFGGSGQSAYTLAVQNNDSGASGTTPMSLAFVQALNQTKGLNVVNLPASTDIASYIRQTSGTLNADPRVLVIPSGFQANLSRGLTVTLTYVSSPGDQGAQVVLGIVASVSDGFSFQLMKAQPLIKSDLQSSSVRTLHPVDYYLPGLVGAFMMTNGVIGLTSIATEFRRRGLTKRLSATPLTKLEWIVGNVLSQALLAILLTAVMIVLGIGLFQSAVTIDLYTIAIVVVGAILFSGIGMVLAGFVKDPEAAVGLGNAIAFPMMFLSGTFWPIEIMPNLLQQIARVLPLTYLSDGLRDSMVLSNSAGALTDTAIVAALAAVFILVGAFATSWKEK
jgi:ABC-2 type transport system permease protein